MNDEYFLAKFKEAVEKRKPEGGETRFLLTMGQYRALNKWFEEVRKKERKCAELIERDTQKKPIYSGDGYADGQLVYDYAECPSCGYDNYEYGINDWGMPFCPNCGQALDWSDNE